MNTRHQNRRQRPPRPLAFTLIEVMISVAIFSMVVAVIYSTWFLILNSSRTAMLAAAQVQRQRVAIHTIEDSLTTIQSFQASPQYYSFIVSNGESSLLSFTSRLPEGFPRGGRYERFSVRRLIFNVEPPPNPDNAFAENANEKDLVMRQYPILTGMDSDEQAFPVVLARNVRKFSVECWDTNAQNWVDEWDTTNSIPPLIKVDLVLGRNSDNLDNSAPTFSISRVIAPPAEMMPTVVQVPSGGNNGSAPNLNLNLGGRSISTGGGR
ncbi:MAG TPA: prepilin-type N-terminal cleavage/methylation domain-containing protein [Verrucomicrobiae bacterium]|jgi:prepilin-type N-terminal cleavage/methylation domain-containing protein